MVYGEPLCEWVTALRRQPLSTAPEPGRFHVKLLTKLCGVSAPVGPRSSSGSALFSGENQWFKRSSDFESVYDAVRMSGAVRCASATRTPWYHERPSLVSRSMRRKPFGTGVILRVASACACVRYTPLGFDATAAFNTSFGIAP